MDRGQVLEILKTLTAEQAELIFQKAVDKKTYGEIAEDEGWSEGIARNRLSVVYAKLNTTAKRFDDIQPLVASCMLELAGPGDDSLRFDKWNTKDWGTTIIDQQTRQEPSDNLKRIGTIGAILLIFILVIVVGRFAIWPAIRGGQDDFLAPAVGRGTNTPEPTELPTEAPTELPAEVSTPEPTENLDATAHAIAALTIAAIPTPNPEDTAAAIVAATVAELTRIVPTALPSDTPLPTDTPAPTQDPRLFADNFNTDIGPGWNMSGNNYSMVNGELSSSGWFNSFVGDETWTDYKVIVDITYLIYSNWEDGLQFHIRKLDGTNYMALQLKSLNGCEIQWLVVENGVVRTVTNTKTWLAGWRDCYGLFEIIAEGNSYIVKKDGKQELAITNDTFDRGGFGIVGFDQEAKFKFTIDEVEIVSLP